MQQGNIRRYEDRKSSTTSWEFLKNVFVRCSISTPTGKFTGKERSSAPFCSAENILLDSVGAFRDWAGTFQGHNSSHSSKTLNLKDGRHNGRGRHTRAPVAHTRCAGVMRTRSSTGRASRAALHPVRATQLSGN